MLEGRQGGGGGFAGADDSYVGAGSGDRGGANFGRSSPMDRGGSAGGGRSVSDAIDDDIPF